MLTLAEKAACDLIDICQVESGHQWGVHIGGTLFPDQFLTEGRATDCRDALRKDAISSFSDTIYQAVTGLIEACEMVVENY